MDTQLLKEIRHCIYKGLGIGHERFKQQIEMRTGQRVSAKKR
jgi:hypothetical protein